MNRWTKRSVWICESLTATLNSDNVGGPDKPGAVADLLGFNFDVVISYDIHIGNSNHPLAEGYTC